MLGGGVFVGVGGAVLWGVMGGGGVVGGVGLGGWGCGGGGVWLCCWGVLLFGGGVVWWIDLGRRGGCVGGVWGVGDLGWEGLVCMFCSAGFLGCWTVCC